MNFRKFLVAGALSCSLAFSGLAVLNQPAYAIEFSDTSGFSTEASINKLVSLGVMRNPGANFNPDAALSRAEFAYMVNQVMSLSTGKKVAFKDLPSKNALYSPVLKMVNNGYLTTSKGSVKPSKGVTYAEMSKALAQGLGLKKTWTNRSIDHLFYLVRKEVLDIDTDLDTVVTREQAAVAFDRFITVKGVFTENEGIIVGATSKTVTINNGIENKTYAYASNASIFVAGQAATIADVVVGSPANVVINKKGTLAYISGELLDSEENTLKFNNATSNWTVGTGTKELNDNAFVASLPNNPKTPFTIKRIDDYQKAGAEFSAQVLYTNANVVTGINPWISKAKDKDVTISGNTLTLTLSTTISEKFTINSDVKVTLDGKEAKLTDLSGTYTATIEAEKFGTVTVINATTKK